jgi:hypothetical protein
MNQEGRQGAGAKAVRNRPELTGLNSPLEHLLDQAAGADDDLIEVELGQLGESSKASLLARSATILARTISRNSVSLESK